MIWLWIYWPLALAFIALVLFAIPEALALRYGGPTFSLFMATMARKGAFGRMWIAAWFLMIGVLTCHFLGWCVGCKY
jgi:hypothetical protein